LELFANQQPFYFVTFNTHEHRSFLASDLVHTCFADYCRRAVPHGVAVGRYVLMPDHAHLFVATSEGLKLTDWVRTLRTVLGKQLLAEGHHKPHWQEGFFDHVLRSSESYSQKWEYVRMNPVRAGLCENAEDWPFQGEIVRLDY
jgi:REP element-mobilizing transposase RayT